MDSGPLGVDSGALGVGLRALNVDLGGLGVDWEGILGALGVDTDRYRSWLMRKDHF